MSARSDSVAIRLGVVAAVLILLAIATASLVRMNRFADAAQWVNHTHEVIEGLTGISSVIKDAETAQRGFLLAGEDSYLDRYYASRSAIKARLEAVKKLASDEPSQLERLRDVEALTVQRIALLEAGVQARRGNSGPLRLTSKHFAEGRGAMDGIRRLLGDMQDEQNGLLKARSVALERDRSTSKLMLVVGNAVALGLLLTSLTVMMREMRQRKQAELQARRSAEQVEDLYNNAPCGYHSIDRDGVIVQINDTELSWLGYTREEVVYRKKLPELMMPESRARFASELAAFKQRGFSRDLEYELVRKDGTALPVSLSATLMRDAAGNFLMSRSTLFDATERRQTEQELHRANAFLDSVLEHIPNMIFVKDAHALRFVRFNRAGETLLGIPRHELIGKSDFDLFPPDQAAFFVAKDREVLAGGRLVEIEEEVIRTRAHGERMLHTCKIPIADEAGNSRYLLGISEDITERRRAQHKIVELNQALEVRARQLEVTNSELESFSYSVSHDLRSPLRAIDGFSRILEEDHARALDAEGLRLLAVIRNNTYRMSQLIDDLLTFSRLGRQEFASVKVNMSALAQDSWRQLCDGEARQPRLTMGSLPDACGDPVLLRQVWVNLMSNAIKYSGTRPEPTVEISAKSEGANIVYCVSDNGVGFDMRYSDKLFGVFQRLHSMEEFPGTGVGLAIVKRVITRHGGCVWADSVLGSGARFYFNLPEGRTDERA